MRKREKENDQREKQRVPGVQNKWTQAECGKVVSGISTLPFYITIKLRVLNATSFAAYDNSHKKDSNLIPGKCKNNHIICSILSCAMIYHHPFWSIRTKC